LNGPQTKGEKMATEQRGIKESLELLDGVKALLVDGKKIMADGKVSFADLPVLFDLMQQAGILTAAFQGLNDVPAEVKDLTAEEANQLLAKVLEVVAGLRAA
jgi:hypothetical protein